jgi:hypothetical protein
VQAGKLTAEAMRAGRKLMVWGNGGSAADSQHLVAEFVSHLTVDRPALRAIALTTDSSILTAIGNDYSYDNVLERQVEALGLQGCFMCDRNSSLFNKQQVAVHFHASALLTLGHRGPLKFELVEANGKVTACQASDTPIRPVDIEAINVQAIWEQPTSPPVAVGVHASYCAQHCNSTSFGGGGRRGATPPPP